MNTKDRKYVSGKVVDWLITRADYIYAQEHGLYSFCLDRRALPASEPYVRAQLRKLGYGTVARRDSRFLGVYKL